MENLKARKLSGNQEAKLLRLLAKQIPINNGSSRLVYEHPFDRSKIVKVAVGSNAFRQNRIEVKFWNKTQSPLLARIYEYGRFVEVMERCEECYDEDSLYEKDMEYADPICDIYDFMVGYLGCTGDNYQIGVMKDGRFAAYDYGFIADDESPRIGNANEFSDKRTSRKFCLTAADLIVAKRPVNQINRLVKY